MGFKGKNAIITGGANGIGKAFVSVLIEKGCNVVIIDIDSNGLHELKKEFPDIKTYICDISNSEQVEKTINSIFQDCEKIDILINNAGIIHNEPLLSFSEKGLKKHSIKNWEKTISVNLNSVFYVTVNVVEKMLQKRTKGIIVNISSVSSTGNAGQSAYSASKSAINSLTIAWAKELGPLGIRVAALSPGFFDIESTHINLNQEKEKELKRMIPLRRFGSIDCISDALIFIIENEYFNGKVLEIDGGLKL